MTETGAIELASRFAEQEGYDPSKYEAAAMQKQGRWEVNFQSKEDKPRPGDFFTIYIDDKSSSVERIVYGK